MFLLFNFLERFCHIDFVYLEPYRQGRDQRYQSNNDNRNEVAPPCDRAAVNDVVNRDEADQNLMKENSGNQSDHCTVNG